MTTTLSLEQRVLALCEAMAPTPVVRLADDQVDLFAKLEFNNLGGSSKDRSALWILRQAIERGEVTPRTTIIESSSGNFAIAMASYCAVLGLSFVPVIDANTNRTTVEYLRALTPRVERVTEPDGSGGHLRARLRRVRALRERLDEVYWPNQYTNRDGAVAHYRLTGGELCERFDRLDYMFVGVGTGGTITGLSLRLKETFPGVRLVAVDSAGSVIFGGPSAPRHIPGIGSSIVPPLLEDALIDDLVIVPERAAVAACHDLWRGHGIFAGGSTGSVYAAIRRYFNKHSEHSGHRPTVAFVCADRGTAYADTIYNPRWVAETFPTGAEPLAHATAGTGPGRP